MGKGYGAVWCWWDCRLLFPKSGQLSRSTQVSTHKCVQMQNSQSRNTKEKAYADFKRLTLCIRWFPDKRKTERRRGNISNIKETAKAQAGEMTACE